MSSNSTPLTLYQFRLLAVLALINFVNFAARHVFGPLIPMLRTALSVSGLGSRRAHSLFLVVLAIGSIPFDFLRIATGRKRLSQSESCFGAQRHFVGGLATSFVVLLVARSFVGLGKLPMRPRSIDDIRGLSARTQASAQAIFCRGNVTWRRVRAGG